jgi:hemoglobin-like flavoprotein
MLTEAQRRDIVQSFKLVVPIAETAADLFYRRLFELKPTYRQLFPEDMKSQKGKLIKMLAFIVKSLDFADADWKEHIDEDEDLFLLLLALGRRHSDLYKIPDESYAPVGEALLWTLDYGLGKAFTPKVKDAWSTAYEGIALIMQMGKHSVVELKKGQVS